jgi:ATP-dependent protease ClpP protease subunit
MSNALKKWYDIKAQAANNADPQAAAGVAPQAAGRVAELYIYGNIGDSWSDTDVIAAELVREVAALDVESIVVRINSFGGSVPEGLAIYNALKRHPANIDVQIDGVAISCASYIAMAGDTITMAQNAMMMIHAPWSVAVGNSQDMRDAADMMDKYAAAMATSYAAASGKPAQACLDLLTDGKDHYYTAAEALAEGFCTSVGPANAIAAAQASGFDLSRFNNSPAAAAAPKKEQSMKPENTVPAAAGAAPFARSNDMNQSIMAAFKPFADRDGVQALQTAILADNTVTVEAAGAKLLAHLGAKAEPINPPGTYARVAVVEDESDKFRANAVDAIMVRAAAKKADANFAQNPVRGLRMLDIARASLDRLRIDMRGKSQMDIVAMAFTQTGSDFPVLLENVMHKSLQSAYALAPMTWSRWCRTGSVTDFRAHNRYRIGSIGDLSTINEAGEFANKSIPDGEKSSITATTKGNIINLTRQAIINDDLDAFVGLAANLGRAAARTVESAAYALLAQNTGLGPTQTDADPYFHASRSNIASTGALSMSVVESFNTVMGSQKAVGSTDEILDLMPKVLLVPLASRGTAVSLNASEYDPSATNNNSRRPNTVRGMFDDVIATARLAGTRGYAFADPQQNPAFEVAFLDGQTEPYLEIQNGFDVDGSRMKVRLDFGVAAIDYRPAVTFAGA